MGSDYCYAPLVIRLKNKAGRHPPYRLTPNLAGLLATTKSKIPLLNYFISLASSPPLKRLTDPRLTVEARDIGLRLRLTGSDYKDSQQIALSQRLRGEPTIGCG